MRSGRSGCTRTRWMSRSRGSGSTSSSVNVSPKSIDTDSVPISTPTSSRSPSSTMSLTWPMRGGGGKNHLSTLGVLRNAGELAPALAFVLADVDVRRQRADQHDVAALQLAAARRPQIEMREAVVAPGPGHAAVFALRNADAVRCGEQRAVVERGHRADEASGQRAVLDRPALAVLLRARRRHRRCRPRWCRSASARGECCCRRWRSGSSCRSHIAPRNPVPPPHHTGEFAGPAMRGAVPRWCLLSPARHLL